MANPDEIQGNREEQASAEIRQRFERRVLKRLPLTFQSYFNQQLRAWDTLFPHEREDLLPVLSYLNGLSPTQQAELFHGVRRVEGAMGVSQWLDYSTREQTIEDASLLARSPDYLEWRREVEKAFDQIRQGIQAQQVAGPSLRRLILMIFPACLPFDPATVWKVWPATGKTLRVEMDASSGDLGSIQTLFEARGPKAHDGAGSLAEALARRSARSASDVWVVDAGAQLSEFVLDRKPQAKRSPNPTVLSYERLRPFREAFLAEVNKMSHSLSSADAIYDRLRKMDMDSFCPEEVKSNPLVQEFVRTLLLSGNGAPVFGNAFVEWAAVQAFKRARPSILIGYFGTRNKPKPFTSVAVFENQETASPLPSVKDFPGSAADAGILAYYLWLASTRYREYQNALTLCLAESLKTAFVVGPPENPLLDQTEPLSLARISSLLGFWLA